MVNVSSDSLQVLLVAAQHWLLALAGIGLVALVALMTRLLPAVNQTQRLLDCVEREKQAYVESAIPEIAEIDAYNPCKGL